VSWLPKCPLPKCPGLLSFAVGNSRGARPLSRPKVKRSTAEDLSEYRRISRSTGGSLGVPQEGGGGGGKLLLLPCSGEAGPECRKPLARSGRSKVARERESEGKKGGASERARGVATSTRKSRDTGLECGKPLEGAGREPRIHQGSSQKRRPGIHHGTQGTHPKSGGSESGGSESDGSE
jgi:hypothetical protein